MSYSHLSGKLFVNTAAGQIREFRHSNGRALQRTPIHQLAPQTLGRSLRWGGGGLNEVADWNDKAIVRIDPCCFRSAEVETLFGDPLKAKQKFGWVPETMVQEICNELVAS